MTPDSKLQTDTQRNIKDLIYQILFNYLHEIEIAMVVERFHETIEDVVDWNISFTEDGPDIRGRNEHRDIAFEFIVNNRYKKYYLDEYVLNSDSTHYHYGQICSPQTKGEGEYVIELNNKESHNIIYEEGFIYRGTRCTTFERITYAKKVHEYYTEYNDNGHKIRTNKIISDKNGNILSKEYSNFENEPSFEIPIF